MDGRRSVYLGLADTGSKHPKQHRVLRKPSDGTQEGRRGPVPGVVEEKRRGWRAPGACVAGGAHKARTARRKQNGGTLCGVSVEYTGYVGDL